MKTLKRSSSITSSRPTARPAHLRGVSLIEVMIVVLLFSIGLVGLVTMQARATQFSVSAEDTGRAALLANELASQMWAANTVNLPAGTVTAWQDRVADMSNGGLPNSTATVAITGNVARITVQWRAPKAAVGEENRYVTDVLLAAPTPASGP